MISNNLSFVFRDINPNSNDPLYQEEKALVEQTFNSLKNIISLPTNSAQ